MKLYLKGARLNYTQSLFTAQTPRGGTKAKFSLSAIIEPTTKAYFGDVNPDNPAGKAVNAAWGDPKAEFSKAIIAVAQKQWGDKAMEIIKELKAKNRLCLRDGAEKASVPGYAGNLFVNASSDVAPLVRHGKTGQSLKASDGVIYSGCYGDVIIDVWAQDPKSNPEWGKRVNASLLGVAFSHDGERLAGGATASEDDFAPVSQEQQQAAAGGDGAGSLFA